MFCEHIQALAFNKHNRPRFRSRSRNSQANFIADILPRDGQGHWRMDGSLDCGGKTST